MNKVTLIGRVGEDPISKTTEKGHLTTFSFATQEFFKDKQGQKQKRVEWHEIAVWNKERFCVHLKKGMLLSISGEIRYNSYTKDINGEKVTFKTTSIMVAGKGEIEILSKKEDDDIQQSESESQDSAN